MYYGSCSLWAASTTSTILTTDVRAPATLAADARTDTHTNARATTATITFVCASGCAVLRRGLCSWPTLRPRACVFVCVHVLFNVM